MLYFALVLVCLFVCLKGGKYFVCRRVLYVPRANERASGGDWDLVLIVFWVGHGLFRVLIYARI